VTFGDPSEYIAHNIAPMYSEGQEKKRSLGDFSRRVFPALLDLHSTMNRKNENKFLQMV